jgi:hypothetical protein
MTDPEEICSSISGDERKTVIDTAHKRIIEMMGKAGETEPITETKADFKKGFKRTKCEDQPPLPIPPLLRGETEGLWRNPASPVRRRPQKPASKRVDSFALKPLTAEIQRGKKITRKILACFL